MNYDDKIVINNRKIINYDNVSIHSYKENVLFIVISNIMIIVILMLIVVILLFMH